MKKKNGITMIALITIVVILLILVSVTVRVGDISGIISRTKEGGKAYNKSGYIENKRVDEAEKAQDDILEHGQKRREVLKKRVEE